MLLHQIRRLIPVLVVFLLGTSLAKQFHQLEMNNTTTQTILKDIQNAFKTVTNNTVLLYKLIPEMYNFTGNNVNSTFAFKIPNLGVGYSMLWMQRSDFLEPIFPNISAQTMIMMKKRRNGVHEIVLKKSSKNSSGSTSEFQNKDDWSMLGLDGWTGEISKPFDELQTNQYNDVAIKDDDENHTGEILININKNIQTTPATETEKVANRTENGLYERELAENVYIARVNNPFGYSTHWKLRNAISLKPVTNFTMEDRPKRDVIELYSMIRCSTGCEPLTYKGYGCYCGFLGAGIPVNGIDRCCKLHDKCYEQSNCISYLEYFVPYLWKCYRGKPLCAIDHGEWGGPQSCAARLCYCDLHLSRCLRKFSCPRHRAVCTSSKARQLQNLLFFK